MAAKVEVVLNLTLNRPVDTDKESENLAAAIEREVKKLHGQPGLMSRLDSAFPGVIECEVVDFSVMQDG